MNPSLLRSTNATRFSILVIMRRHTSLTIRFSEGFSGVPRNVLKFKSPESNKFSLKSFVQATNTLTIFIKKREFFFWNYTFLKTQRTTLILDFGNLSLAVQVDRKQTPPCTCNQYSQGRMRKNLTQNFRATFLLMMHEESEVELELCTSTAPRLVASHIQY